MAWWAPLAMIAGFWPSAQSSSQSATSSIGWGSDDRCLDRRAQPGDPGSDHAPNRRTEREVKSPARS